MLFLKQSTAVTVKIGPFVDSSDGVTAETALTIQKADVRLSKNGGDFGAANADQGVADAGAAHDELGYYDISLDTTDTNTLGRLKLAISDAAAVPVWQEFTVLAANVFDSMIGGSDSLEVDAVAISGDSSAADNLETACDGGTYNIGGGAVVAASITEKTGFSLAQDQSTVTIGTVNALTGHTPQSGDSFARLGEPAGSDIAADIAEGTAGIAVVSGQATTLQASVDALDNPVEITVEPTVVE
jgi:hypothetical protein